MSDQVYAQAINLIDTLAQKHHVKGLNEFEYQLYEKLSVAMSVYFGGLTYAFQVSAMKTEMDASAQEALYLIWLKEEEAKRLKEEKDEKNQDDKPPEPEPEV